jgi:hypothetical protein
MLERNTAGDFFTESYCWEDGGAAADTVDLSYLKLAAMDSLARYDTAWIPVMKKSMKLLQNGIKPSGMFWDKYDISTGSYGIDEGNLINNLLCAINLAQVDLPSGGVLSLLKSEWMEKGKILGGYGTDSLEVTADFENIAVYALALRLAVLLGDVSFAGELYNKLISWQITDKTSYFYGAFATTEAHSFDNLEALLSLQELRGRL